MKKASLVTMPPFNQGEIFNLENTKLNRDGCLLFYHFLQMAFRERGFDLNTDDLNPVADSDFVIYVDVPKKMPADKDKSCLLLLESSLIRPDNWDRKNHRHFHKIFTWNDSLVDNETYFKLHFDHHGKVPFLPFAEKKKFCTLIAGNKDVQHPLELYSERKRAIRWFELHHPEDFEFYGVGWDMRTFSGPIWIRALNRVKFIRRALATQWPSYRGTVDSKLEVMSQYKFSICYENIRDVEGYITEKIFDSLASGCVPVYWGAPNITQFIPQNCFIDRQEFKSYEDLYQYLRGMSPAEYDFRLSEIEKYLASPQHRPFTPEVSARSVVRGILGDT